MIERYQTIPLPEAADDAAIGRLLHHFATSPLPAFVIRRAGPELDAVVDRLTPLLPTVLQLDREGFVIADNDGSNTENRRDAGVHLDVIELTSPNKTPVTLHHTSEGEAVASFFLPGLRSLELARQRSSRLPEDTTHLFRQGQVNTDFLQAHCHRAYLRAGDAVLFKDGLPLVHDFTTITTPRFSRIGQGTLAMPNLLGQQWELVGGSSA